MCHLFAAMLYLGGTCAVSIGQSPDPVLPHPSVSIVECRPRLVQVGALVLLLASIIVQACMVRGLLIANRSSPAPHLLPFILSLGSVCACMQVSRQWPGREGCRPAQHCCATLVH